MIGKLWDVLASMPSTNLRIALTLVMTAATSVRVIGWTWDPPESWLVFLSVWAGIDVAQWTAKRLTNVQPAAGPTET